ncbi:hypothetical protein COK_0638 [Mannheimia haemolytica serotype A2 str. BOVINE]|nr:hypothetical protein COK_0638 [Mannheimia haemolytica serotype A2 str. BOVINE]
MSYSTVTRTGAVALIPHFSVIVVFSLTLLYCYFAMRIFAFSGFAN